MDLLKFVFDILSWIFSAEERISLIIKEDFSYLYFVFILFSFNFLIVAFDFFVLHFFSTRNFGIRIFKIFKIVLLRSSRFLRRKKLPSFFIFLFSFLPGLQKMGVYFLYARRNSVSFQEVVYFFSGGVFRISCYYFAPPLIVWIIIFLILFLNVAKLILKRGDSKK